MTPASSPLGFPWTVGLILGLVEGLLGLALVAFPNLWWLVVATPVPVFLGLAWAHGRTPKVFEEVVEVAPPPEADAAPAADPAPVADLALGADLALAHFRFSEAERLATLLLGESERFARGEVHAVLQGFRSLEATASSIEAGVRESFHSMMSSDSPRSLGAIADQSQTIALELKDFFAGLGALEAQAQNYLQAHQSDLERVSAMATKIEDFFENIRMISLNLSIEASRAGSGPAGKAFQVLAQKLREFSTEAQQISSTQKVVVDAAGRGLRASQTDLREGFAGLAGRIPPLRDRLDPFSAIVENSRQTLQGVLGELAKLSTAVKAMLTTQIGQLQFQDLNRQEYEHLLEAIQGLVKRTVLSPPDLSAEVATEERLLLARSFNERITTSNERKVLQEFLTGAGLAADAIEVKGSSRASGTVELF